MTARLRSGWQKIKQHPFIASGIIVVLLALIVLVVVVVLSNGTGFNGYTVKSTVTETTLSPQTKVTTTTQSQPGKTLWDWLQLLILPILFVIGGFWLNQIQKSREERTTEQRAQTELEIAADNQREAALQDYIDKMSELLLKEGLRESQPEDEVRKIARVRTLTVLQRLDEIRKRSLLQFLYESNLIDKDNAIIDASGVDLDFVRLFKPKEDEDFPRRFGDNLSGANLHKADLYRADLRRADLRQSNLSGADLRRADLRRANLSEADFRGADLRGVSLCDYLLIEANREGANLQEADLSDAELSRADLSGADLSDAELDDAIVTDEQLAKAKSLKGATMPDGSIHP